MVLPDPGTRIRAAKGTDVIDQITRSTALLAVADGLLLRETESDRLRSALLYGAPDVLPVDPDPTVAVRWTVLLDATVVVMDPDPRERTTWPPHTGTLLDNVVQQLTRAAEVVAIGHLPRVEDRVLAMLWHLADRWGRVSPEGVVVPVPLPHRIIGQLVGAQRPSVSLALTALMNNGTVRRRREDRFWMIDPGSRPALLGPG